MMNVLAFFAHPDDETMLCGGTLALLAQNGTCVHYLCATRGEGGELGDPPICSREQVAQVRSDELACAVKQMNGTSLQFMDYIDPLVGPNEDLFAFRVDYQTLITQISDILSEKNIDVLITHGSNGEYGHPAHLLIHGAAVEAVKRDINQRVSLYTVQANFDGHPKPRLANQDDPADLVLDIRRVLDKKIAAAMCHRTQHALFVRRTSARLGHPVSVPEVIMQVESLHRVWPDQTGQEDKLTALLRETGALLVQ